MVLATRGSDSGSKMGPYKIVKNLIKTGFWQHEPPLKGQTKNMFVFAEKRAFQKPFILLIKVFGGFRTPFLDICLTDF